MLAKRITYTDYNGDERTETFYFNLTKAELMEMQMVHPGGYAEYLQRIVDAKDQPQVVEAFKTFILNSYGEKSEDGKRFVKSEELSKAFEQTEAYSELFVELLSDPDGAANFIKGIIPDLGDVANEDINEKTKKLIESKKSE